MKTQENIKINIKYFSKFNINIIKSCNGYVNKDLNLRHTSIFLTVTQEYLYYRCFK